MTPIAAYYIFIASENERTTSAGHRLLARRERPSLLDRILSFATGLRSQPSLPRPA
jgi:hypothetical protein